MKTNENKVIKKRKEINNEIKRWNELLSNNVLNNNKKLN